MKFQVIHLPQPQAWAVTRGLVESISWPYPSPRWARTLIYAGSKFDAEEQFEYVRRGIRPPRPSELRRDGEVSAIVGEVRLTGSVCSEKIPFSLVVEGACWYDHPLEVRARGRIFSVEFSIDPAEVGRAQSGREKEETP